jgi:excisionase family DNA binding protein
MIESASMADLEKMITRIVAEQLQSIQTKSGLDDKFLSVNEAAALLKVSKDTIYQKTSKNEIPFYKQLNRLFFKKEEILDYIHQGKTSTVSESNARLKEFLKVGKR